MTKIISDEDITRRKKTKKNTRLQETINLTSEENC